MYVLTVRNCLHFCRMNVMNVTVFYLLPLAKCFLAVKDRGWQRMRWLDHITDLMDMSLTPESNFGS